MTLHGYQRPLALGFAHAAHHGHYDRDGELHIKHVQRVVAKVQSRRTESESAPGGAYYTFRRLGGLLDEVIAVAWLHDVIEDTHVTAEYLRSTGFAPVVIEAVRLLTRPEDGTDYLDYVESIADADGPAGTPRQQAAEIARLVKLADLEDNLARSVEEGNSGTARKYARALTLIQAAIDARGEQR